MPTVTHTFISGKGDGSDTSLVRPTDWNADHKVYMGSNKIIARLSVGTGPAEEFPCTAYMIGILNTPDQNGLLAALGLPTTGDAKLTMKVIADTGWVMMNDGSIGDLGSNATTRALPDTVTLFTLLYSNCNDVTAPLQTSAGAATLRVAQGSAATAFNAKCRIVLPKQLGRAFLAAGAGAGMSTRSLGSIGGAETHVITAKESHDHRHDFFYDPGTTLRSSRLNDERLLRVSDVKVDALATDTASAGVPVAVGVAASSDIAVTSDTPPTVTPFSVQEGTTEKAEELAGMGNDTFDNNPMPIMQPWAAWNVMIKL